MRLHAASGLACLLLLATAGEARASSGLDSPDGGVVQLGRGGAWVARADDPLAAYYNPAGLARQASGAFLGAHLMFSTMCFARVDENGNPVSPGQGLPGPGAPDGPDAKVCRDDSPFPNPQLGAAFRVTDRLAVGLAVLGPHAVGKQEWPESVSYARGDQPAPQRYLLTTADALLVFPTLSVAYSPTPDLSVGAGFIWGIASVSFTNFAEAASPAPAPGQLASDDFYSHQDLKAKLSAKDLFIPGVVLGGLWSPSPTIDVAGAFRWEDPVHAHTGDLYVQAKYWRSGGAKADTDPSKDGPGNPKNITDEKDAATSVKIPIPMEARLGARFHQPRKGAKRPAWAGPAGASARRVTDTLSEDVFDVEADVTWAHNSAVDAIELRFKKGIDVKGTGGGVVPENADVPHHWKDVVGVRLGGDYVILPSRLAVRAGGFFETKGQDAEYLNVDFDLAQRYGLALGATVRLGPVDVSAAFQHTFFGTLDNEGKGKVYALSGDGTRPDYHSRQPVNGGSLTSSLSEVALGGTFRF